MGSGLVYAAVGLVWAWYAASRVASSRAGRRADQESSAHARVIRRAVRAGSPDGAGGPGSDTAEVSTGPGAATGAAAGVAAAAADGPSGRRWRPGRRSRAVAGSDVVVTAPVGARPAPRGPVTRVVSRSARRAAVRRRRTVLTLLVVAALGLGASVALGYLPLWAAAPAPLLCCAYLVAGARASRRSTHTVAAMAPVVAVAEVDDPSWAGVPFVDVVADWCRAVPGQAQGTAAVEAPVAAAADGDAERFEAARLRSASTPAVEDAGARAPSWRAVPVPLPTYVTAPRVARTVKTIDLGSTGAWTSGRTAPPPLALPVGESALPAGAVREGADAIETVSAGQVSAGQVSAGSATAADENTEAIEVPRAATG